MTSDNVGFMEEFKVFFNAYEIGFITSLLENKKSAEHHDHQIRLIQNMILKLDRATLQFGQPPLDEKLTR